MNSRRSIAHCAVRSMGAVSWCTVPWSIADGTACGRQDATVLVGPDAIGITGTDLLAVLLFGIGGAVEETAAPSSPVPGV